MAIYFQTQVVTRTAGADLTESEGCFVKLSSGKVVLTTGSSTADEVFGLLHTTDAKDATVNVILPGHPGIVGVKLHSSASGVVDGTPLTLAASGTATAAAEGDVVVAVALATGTAGELVEARLVQPVAPAAADAGEEEDDSNAEQ